MTSNWILKDLRCQNIKVSLPTGDVRRFSPKFPISLSDLLQQCLAFIPDTEPFDKRKPEFFYQDADNDWITCDSESEFSEMLVVLRNDETIRLKINLAQRDVNSISDPIPVEKQDLIDEDVCCNLCFEKTGQQVAIGKDSVYRSTTTEDFDLCSSCFAKADQGEYKLYVGGKFKEIVKKNVPSISQPITPVKKTFAEQLGLLREMGFLDEVKCTEFLIKNNGDLQACVKDLIF